MIESEFRDWMRGQLRSLDQRIKAVAAQKAEADRIEVDARIKGEMASLAEKLMVRVKGGHLAGLGIVFVTDQGAAMSGFAADGGYFALGGAATFLGLEILEEFRKREAANDSEPSGDAGADQTAG
jgi:hypothetical protein